MDKRKLRFVSVVGTVILRFVSVWGTLCFRFFYHLFDNKCIIYNIYRVRRNYSYWLIRRIGPPVPILRKTERLHLVSMHYYYSPIIIRNNAQLLKRVALFWPWTKWSVTLDLLAFFRTAFVGGSNYGHPERRHLIFLKEKSVFSL